MAALTWCSDVLIPHCSGLVALQGEFRRTGRVLLLLLLVLVLSLPATFDSEKEEVKRRLPHCQP